MKQKKLLKKRSDHSLEMKMNKKKIVALFDFDGTITWNDSLLPFLIFCKGYLKTIFFLAMELPYLIKYLFKLISRQETKERILARFFKGIDEKEFLILGKLYAEKYLDKLIRPNARKRILWHLTQNHQCILVSASIETYLLPWSKIMGFDRAITSIPEIDEHHKATGRLKGKNCWGPEKLARLNACLGDLKEYTIYAYGDSRGDKEMLEIADFPFYREMP